MLHVQMYMYYAYTTNSCRPIHGRKQEFLQQDNIFQWEKFEIDATETN